MGVRHDQASGRRLTLRTRWSRLHRPLLLALAVLAHAVPELARGAAAQVTVASLASPPEAASFTPVDADGRRLGSFEVDMSHGYAALSSTVLETLGWRALDVGPERFTFELDGARLEFEPGVPLVRISGDWVQLALEPYLEAGDLHLPVQVLVDVLTDRMPQRFATAGPYRLQVLSLGAEARPSTEREPAAVVGPTRAAAREVAPARDAIPARDVAPARDAVPAQPIPLAQPADRTRIVVLDPGHGGRDPGSVGPTGVREKDVALALARAIRTELERYPDLEVHLTRDGDELVPLWERGVVATRLKGDRPGIFVSIHTNAVGNRGVRGVETYFLAEARTEHERRVAALENEAASFDRIGADTPGAGDDLGFILSELSNLDHIHWSSDLAAAVQGELARVHPGPDRGVKQGPLAVITNALMPAVLVEAGFISNPGEESALADPAFQRETAQAIARAIAEFFDRYPPGRAQRAAPR